MDRVSYNRGNLASWCEIIDDLYNGRIDGEPASEQLVAVAGIVDGLDIGKLRVAEKKDGHWQVNLWAKQAIMLYFKYGENDMLDGGVMSYFDKVPVKREWDRVRVVPPAVSRYGSHLAPGVIQMPSYVNIGAFVDSGTMVDTWATVGSCAQIGKNVHLSGGVGIGGVLEPAQATPVIIEDNAFVGSRCIIVEGAVVHERAVLGANVVITGSTKIIDVTGEQQVIYKGEVPADWVVIPGTYAKQFPAGEYGVPCALIIGKRKASTDLKTSLNATLREYEIS
mgnify:FL=1